MPKDDLYVKIAPTTYFRAPPCYRWKLVEGALPRCDLCPVKVQCKNDIETIKRGDIPWVMADSYTLTTTENPNEVEVPIYPKPPLMSLPEFPKTYGDLKPFAEELLLYGNDTIGDCIISQRTGMDEKNYKPFAPDLNSNIYRRYHYNGFQFCREQR